MTRWEEYTGATNYIVVIKQFSSSESETVKMPTDGAFQGFSVFTDTPTHKSMWLLVISELQKEGLVEPGASFIFVFVDDVVLFLRIKDLNTLSKEEADKRIERIRTLLSQKIFQKFRMKTDLLKSLTSPSKAILLNKTREGVEGIVLTMGHPQP